MKHWVLALTLALTGVGCSLDTAAIVADDAAPVDQGAAADLAVSDDGAVATDAAPDTGATDAAHDGGQGPEAAADGPDLDASPPDAGAASDGPAPADGPPADVAIPVDSAPGDAAPDAGCTQVALLDNGDFELGRTGWSESSSGGYYLIYSTAGLPPDQPPQAGDWAAWLGTFNDADDWLWQSVTVPAGAAALRLTGYRAITTQETGNQPWDYVRLELRSATGALLETLLTYSNLDATTEWQAFAASAQAPHAGATVRLVIHATNDWVDAPSDFFFDSLALEATVCP